MKVNQKAIESFLRHLKGNSATALLVPLFLGALKEFKSQGFVLGFNMETVIVLLIAGAIAAVTVLFQVFVKKRPDLAHEAAFVEKKAIDLLSGVASQEIAKSPDPATHLEGVPGAAVAGSQAPPA